MSSSRPVFSAAAQMRRLCLVALVNAQQHRLDGDEIARAYATVRQTEHDLAHLDASTRALIAEEPG